MPGFTEATRAAFNVADDVLNRARGGARMLPDDPSATPAVAVDALLAVAEQVRALRLVVAERGDDR